MKTYEGVETGQPVNVGGQLYASVALTGLPTECEATNHKLRLG